MEEERTQDKIQTRKPIASLRKNYSICKSNKAQAIGNTETHRQKKERVGPPAWRGLIFVVFDWLLETISEQMQCRAECVTSQNNPTKDAGLLGKLEGHWTMLHAMSTPCKTQRH